MAITKERLEELLEKNSVIFYINIFKDSYGNIIYKGNGTSSYLLDICDTHMSDVGLVLDCDEHVDFNDLYEHEHDAIHASKYVNMERVEKLSLPFWSEIERGYLGDGLKKSDLFYRDIRNKSGAFAVYVNLSGRYIEIIKLGNSGSPSNEVIFDKPLTQENYSEACEIIKKIWEQRSE